MKFADYNVNNFMPFPSGPFPYYIHTTVDQFWQVNRGREIKIKHLGIEYVYSMYL